MANWTLPTIASPYDEVPGLLKALAFDAGSLMVEEPTNPLDGLVKLVRDPVKFQERSSGAWIDRILSVAGGGTGASTPGDARTGLGLGTMAIQNADAVAITGGTLAGNGAGLTNLNASNLASGTVPQARKWTEATITSTGTVDNLDFSNVDLLRCNNSSLLTIRGLVAGVSGQRLTIVSVGTAQVDLANQNANSSAANRIINGVTATISLAKGLGRAELVYDGSSSRWRVADHKQGGFITVPYNAANFFGPAGMTWTVDSGDQDTYAYLLVQRMLTVFLWIRTSSIGGTTLGPPIYATLPGGFTAARNVGTLCMLVNNGPRSTGQFSCGGGSTTINVNLLSFANLVASTDTTEVFGQMTLEVQ